MHGDTSERGSETYLGDVRGVHDCCIRIAKVWWRQMPQSKGLVNSAEEEQQVDLMKHQGALN